MQRHCTELTERLLQSLDEEYNVVDMGVVVDVITALEKTTITKEVLEITRLGKYINELRRKTNNDILAKRAKDLVRRWREMVLPSAHSTPQPTVADTAPPALNGANAQSPALRSLKPQSPAFRGLKPQSPLLKTTSLSRVSSPSLSLHSDQSHSPVVSPNKPPISATSNHRLNSSTTQVDVKSSNQNHLLEAVPRTHSSNKRLRKDNPIVLEVEPANKRQRLNGETLSGSNANSQVPSPTLKERNPELIEPSSNTESTVVKKRGRKKGSKSIKKQISIEDSVKEKLASISRNPKLKTTQELLADLQARGSNSNINVLPSHSVNPPNIEDILRTKNDGEVCKYLSGNQNNFLNKRTGDTNLQQKRTKLEENRRDSPHKYIESDTLDEDTLDSEIPPENNLRLTRDLTVKEILAKLPPLDPDSIDWDDADECCDNNENKTNNKSQEVTEEDLERLHIECVEGLNGNFQPKLSSPFNKSDSIKTCENEVKLDSVIGLHRPSDSHKDEIFREWHEMLARPSFDGQILHILPYVIID
ncbi:PREDICTED: mediator of RNA polymerase II transcription subunit 26-like [Ceratosolen solmsi marchali]|uniref:Mediator of RNA polymerase II transcription subunit 26 n=1 Tax=Ceratosolen solmsi marchali TaxID=326594 RepID=A0AAJ7DVF8_9HYME|nr:PREDICTED: mediator of RNA polymerase II transcription subunit 26-like [Ceratosolen solmsi marchali]